MGQGRETIVLGFDYGMTLYYGQKTDTVNLNLVASPTAKLIKSVMILPMP